MKTFFLLFFSLFILSCEREIQENSLGPSTDVHEIQKAQNRSLAKLDPYQIGDTQRVHQVETQEVISSQSPIKFLSKEWVTEVTEIENSSNERLITTHKKVTDKIYDKDFVYEFKSVFFLEQMDTLKALDQLGEDRYSMKSILQQLREQGQVTEKQIKGVAFHNLKEAEVVLVPPQLVKDSKNCKNLKDCRIKADKISYDVVFLLENGETQTHNVEWILSAEVPFFAALLKQCSTTVVPVENLRVLVKQCNDVVDFDQ